MCKNSIHIICKTVANECFNGYMFKLKCTGVEMKYLIIVLLVLLMAGCGGGGGSDPSPAAPVPTAPVRPTPTTQLPYSPPINWINSANGVIVNDANNDRVTFRADYGYMVFGNTYYANMRVIPGGNGDLYFNGVKVGAVTMIRSESGSYIAGLVCNNGYMADIFGYESTLAILCSNILPVGKVSVKQALSEVFVDAEGTEGKPNAFIDASGETSNPKAGIIQLIEN